MGKLNLIKFFIAFLFFLSITQEIESQEVQNSSSAFFEKVRFGGGLGLGFGNNFTNISVAPAAIYEFNESVAVGMGLQGNYLKQKEAFTSYQFGASLISLFNPIDFLQFAAELEQLRINTSYPTINGSVKNNFWNTALFLGAGYRNRNVTMGIRYNIFYKADDDIYGQAWMPFVRVFF
jgi:hypothetical protein